MWFGASTSFRLVAVPSTLVLSEARLNSPARESPLLSLEPSLTWRRTPSLSNDKATTDKLIATRWRDQRTTERELYAAPLPQHHTVVLPLASSRVMCKVDGRVVHEGVSNAGCVCITPPDAEVSCWFGHSMDAVHLFIPHRMLMVAFEDLNDRAAPSGLTLRAERTQHDPLLCQVASLLLAIGEDPDPSLQLYIDTLGNAAVTRLLSAHTVIAPPRPSAIGKLPAWRLRLALNYLEEHLDSSVTLPELAVAVGLSTMYFAAQFKRATGLSPHKYLTRRRLERAQERMRATNLSLAEVAVAVGFSSQTHFTTTFRTTVGETPARWRQAVTI